MHIDIETLKKFHPFDRLSDANLAKLVPAIRKSALPAGKVLFKETQTDQQSIYLLTGNIELFSGKSRIDTIAANSEAATFALSNTQPRQYSARAASEINIFWLSAKIVEQITSSTQYAVSEVDASEETDENDWMATLLQSPIFQEIPAANIQKVMIRFEPVSAVKDQVLIQEGDDGDYYYFLQSGQCEVSRYDELRHENMRLAVLSSGDTFGEEALVSEAKRSSTVKMLTDGALHRLSKKDFIALIKDSVLNLVDHDEAIRLVDTGAVWLDVRSPEAHLNDGKTNSINIPSSVFRDQLDRLAMDKHYIAYCDHGQLSATSAFLAQEKGYQISILKGGLDPSNALADETKHDEAIPEKEIKDSFVLKKALEQAKTALKKTENEKALLFEELKTLKSKDVKKEQECLQKINQLEQARVAAEKSVNDKIIQLTKLETNKSQQADIEQEYVDKISELEQEVMDVRKDHEQEYYAWQKERDTYKKEIDSLNSLAASETVGNTPKSDVQVLSLTEKIRGLEDALTRSLDQTKLASEGHEQATAHFKQEIETLEQKLNAVQTESDEAVARINELDEKRAQLQAQLQDSVQSDAEKERLLSEYKQQQASTNEQLLTDKQSLNEQLTQLQPQLDEYQSKQRENEQSIASLSHEKTALTQTLSESQATLSQVEDEVQSLKTALEELKQAKQHGTEIAETLNAEASTQLKNKIDQTQGQLDTLTNEKLQLDETNTALNNDVEQLHQQLNDAEVNNRQTVQALGEEKDNLTQQLQTALNDLKQAHSTSTQDQNSNEQEEAQKRAGSLSEELALTQQKIEAIQKKSLEELSMFKSQRDKWEEKYSQEHQRAESYREEFEKLQYAKGNAANQSTQMDDSVNRLHGEYKKLKIANQEDQYALTLEKEEAKRLRKDLLALQVELKQATDLKEQLEASRFSDQDKIGMLQQSLDSRARAQTVVSSGRMPAKKNSKVFYFFVGMLVCMGFLNVVLLWEGNIDITQRLSKAMSGLFPNPEENARQVQPKTIEQETEFTSVVSKFKLPLFQDNIIDGGKGPELVVIPSGSFVMGNNNRGKSESPEHLVTIKSFAISTHEITFDEYDVFATATNRSLPDDAGWGRGKHPVINVSWDDARAYTIWLSQITQRKYRLPSEAEWEYSTAAGTKSKFWWGYQIGESKANCFDCSQGSSGQTTIIGQYGANPFKLYDVAGNVFEWVADCFHEDYQQAPNDGSAWGGSNCSHKTIRGGSFRNLSNMMTTTYRKQAISTTRADDIGFRVVRDSQ